jgi:regulator of sigma E protease
VHECGHFFFARIFKVKINEFSMGMGPVIFKRQSGDTQYSLRLFPIGGFVAMEGEDEDSDDKNAFGKKPPWQRAVIIAAGAMINLILGLILMSVIIASSPDGIGTARIAQFVGENPQSQAHGLMEGDEIKAINGHRVYTSYDINFFMMRDKDAVIDFTVRRDGETINVRSVKFETMEIEGVTAVIYDFKIVGIEKTFGSVLKHAVLDSVSVARIVWISLFDLVTFQFSLNDLAGPIGTMEIIADTASQATSANYSGLLMIMAFITINIGIFNLLPLPALDGGRLIFIIIEGIRKKPIEAKYEALVHSIGIALLLTLMAVVTFNDIVKIFKR